MTEPAGSEPEAVRSSNATRLLRQVPRRYWHYLIAGIVFLVIGLACGWASQPKEPQLRSDAGYQAIDNTYQAGGGACQPTRPNGTTGRISTRETQDCEEAKEHHRVEANGLIEARRSADAANASAIIAYKQTGIAGWNTGIAVVTMLAAIGAAVFAREAALHTERGAIIAAENLAAYRRVSEPKLSITLGEFSDDADAVSFAIFVANVGGSGCVVTGIHHAWCEDGELSGAFVGPKVNEALAPGESKKIDVIQIPKAALMERPHIEGMVSFIGGLIEGKHLERFRFEVFPAISYPHMNWCVPESPLGGTGKGGFHSVLTITSHRPLNVY